MSTAVQQVVSFGDENQGSQVGQNYGTVKNEFHVSSPGLAVGIAAALGTIFTVSSEAIRNISASESFGADAQDLDVVFQAERLRFEKWGEAVGFVHGTLLDRHHVAFDDPATALSVANLLFLVNKICSWDDEDGQQTVPAAGDGNADGGKNKKASLASLGSRAITSIQDKVSRTFRRRREREGQVKFLGTVVQQLHNLVPPTATAAAAGPPKSGSLPGQPPRRSNTMSSLDKLDTQAVPASQHVSTPTTKTPIISAEAIAEQIAEFRKLIDAAEIEQQAKRRQQIHGWLLGKLTENDIYHDSAQRRIDGTCNWILERPEFTKWMSQVSSNCKSSSNMLWIHGKAGFGKTIMCARIIQHLQSTLDTPVAYFFFTSALESRDNPFDAMRSWVSQIASQDMAAFAKVQDTLRNQHENAASRTTIVKLFQSIVALATPLVLVIDGLDECTCWGDDEPVSVPRFLQTVKQAIRGTGTRLMIVSRDEPEIRRSLEGSTPDSTPEWGLLEYGISRDDVRPDTMSYSKSIVSAKLTRQTDDVFLDYMAEQMTERCDGQFLWLKLQGKSLRSTMTKKALQKFIDDAPAGLDHLYERNWSRIVSMRDDDRDRSISLLRWAAFAVRPLTVSEMTEAVLVNDDDDDMDDFPTDDLPYAIDEDYITNEIVGLCGSLVEVRGDVSQEIKSRTIHLTHFSVKQFLLVHLIDAQLPKSLGEIRQHSMLAKACLSYVNFESVWAETDNEEEEANELSLGTSFRNYAAVHWPQHTRLGKSVEDKNKDEDVMRLIYDLFSTTSPNWEPWRKCFDAADTDLKESNEGVLTEETAEPSPLYYAAGLNLTAVALTLAEENPEDVAFTGIGRSPLLAASTAGNVALVKAFLEAGASVDVRNKHGATPLYSASQKGHIKVVEMLHKHGAEAATTTNSGWTAVARAAMEGYAEVVKRLLGYGAHAKGLTIYNASPLHVPCFRGHLECVKLLIRGGADVHVFTEGMSTPLYFACDQRHVEIARLLLESGVDPDAAQPGKGTPLIVACTKGHVEIVKVLLEHKADATKPIGMITPMSVAAKNGFLEILQLLLDYGADTSAAAESGNWSPLHSAAGEAQLEAVRLLLQHGADASLKETEGATPLYAVCVYQSRDKMNGDNSVDADAVTVVAVAELLLNAGCDANESRGDGFTCLHAACLNGNLALVQLLLSYGADTKAQSGHGMNAFLAACMAGSEEVCRHLLDVDPDTDVNQPKTDGWTPLHAAASNGSVAVANLLLERGAASQPEPGDTNRDLPLLVAAESGHLEMVKILIDAGTDVAATNDKGHAAIHKAAAFGHVDVLDFLVSIGADLHAEDLAGANLLHLAAWNGRAEVTEWLLDRGFPINCVQGDGNTPLMGACRNGCADTVKLLLERGADSSLCGADLCQPLTLAVLRGHLDVVKHLVHHSDDAKAAINDAGDLGFSPLHAACETSHVDIVEFLLASGGDVSVPAKNGCNGLHMAAAARQVEVIKILLKHHPKDIEGIEGIEGIVVNGVNAEAQTALFMAARNNQVEIARMLLQNGADLSVPAEDGTTAIQVAILNEYKELAELLVSHGADLNKPIRGYSLLQQAVATGREGAVALLLALGADIAVPLVEADAGGTILHTAAEVGRVEICRMLLGAGVDVLAAADDGTTAVYTATVHNHPQVVKLLIEHGADVEAAKSDGWLPMHVATKNGCSETLSVLIDAGIDLDKPQKGEGWTLLQALVEMDNLELVRFFVKHGAGVNAPGEEGSRPLHYACSLGHLDIATYLLAQGADPAIANDQGFTALHVAAASGFHAVVQALLSHGAAVDVRAADDDDAANARQTPLHSASANGHHDAVKTLLDGGADVSTTNANMRTALHVAAREGRTAVVKLLIDRGAAVDAPDGTGCTALMLASMDGFAETVTALLERGADVEAPTNLGLTPLAAAATNGAFNAAQLAAFQGHADVMQALFDYGVNIATKDRNGNTPLHFAIWLHKDDVVSKLLDIDETAYDPTSDGTTLLHMAAWSGSMGLFRSLKKYGLDVAAVTNGGWSMMHGAVQEGKVDMVKYLLARLGPELLQPDVYGRSLVFLAARAGRIKVLKALLAANIGCSPAPSAASSSSPASSFSPTAPDCFGHTPLDAAVRNGHVLVIKRLLAEHKREGNLPRRDAKDTFGRTLMSWARSTGFPLVLDALQPLTSSDDGADADTSADEHELSAPFDEEQSWCALCLLSLSSTAPLWVCKTCDDMACFCTSCKDRGIVCREGHTLSLR